MKLPPIRRLIMVSGISVLYFGSLIESYIYEIPDEYSKAKVYIATFLFVAVCAAVLYDRIR